MLIGGTNRNALPCLVGTTRTLLALYECARPDNQAPLVAARLEVGRRIPRHPLALRLMYCGFLWPLFLGVIPQLLMYSCWESTHAYSSATR